MFPNFSACAPRFGLKRLFSAVGGFGILTNFDAEPVRLAGRVCILRGDMV
ncbi:hypothetical protein HMPREF1545_01459 [Oscillibacter sp. KLE 1728]|nr:hypothetical protein HMPREF1546_02940 [Oscillibacter sp. KLE 1745]ERK61937.1 hypothetical protein HMPREF1545_01459 [Oscillibacter sp. KLE 1728]